MTEHTAQYWEDRAAAHGKKLDYISCQYDPDLTEALREGHEAMTELARLRAGIDQVVRTCEEWGESPGVNDFEAGQADAAGSLGRDIAAALKDAVGE